MKRIAATDGVEAVSPALTLSLIHIEGRVPDSSGTGDTFAAPAGPPTAAAKRRRAAIGLQPDTVTGIDASEPDLGLVKADQISEGRFLRPASATRRW